MSLQVQRMALTPQRLPRAALIILSRRHSRASLEVAAAWMKNETDVRARTGGQGGAVADDANVLVNDLAVSDN